MTVTPPQELIARLKAENARLREAFEPAVRVLSTVISTLEDNGMKWPGDDRSHDLFTAAQEIATMAALAVDSRCVAEAADALENLRNAASYALVRMEHAFKDPDSLKQSESAMNYYCEAMHGLRTAIGKIDDG